MKYKINDEGLEEGKFPSSTGKQVLIENKASILKTIDDKFIGVLGVSYTKRKHTLSENELHILEHGAAAIGSALCTHLGC